MQLKLKVTEDTNELPKKDKIETSNENTKESNPKQELDPTRFGDWEKNGRCSDF
ncbi:MAG: DUF1674 domain-containing protein [Alphaproteobacteria bacterium]|nr:DUF1674 domain-containing protein [Alphaproteobacteria bacterium]MDP3532174.1 DUF1674 domain-containing protein [Alphaproteobacteria bacterium]